MSMYGEQGGRPAHAAFYPNSFFSDMSVRWFVTRAVVLIGFAAIAWLLSGLMANDEAHAHVEKPLSCVSDLGAGPVRALAESSSEYLSAGLSQQALFDMACELTSSMQDGVAAIAQSDSMTRQESGLLSLTDNAINPLGVASYPLAIAADPASLPVADASTVFTAHDSLDSVQFPESSGAGSILPLPDSGMPSGMPAHGLGGLSGNFTSGSAHQSGGSVVVSSCATPEMNDNCVVGVHNSARSVAGLHRDPVVSPD